MTALEPGPRPSQAPVKGSQELLWCFLQWGSGLHASPVLRELRAQQEGSGEVGVMPSMGNSSEGQASALASSRPGNGPTGTFPQVPILSTQIWAPVCWQGGPACVTAP